MFYVFMFMYFHILYIFIFFIFSYFHIYPFIDFYIFVFNITLFWVVIASGFHLFPFRTEKLSPFAPMVLQCNVGE